MLKHSEHNFNKDKQNGVTPSVSLSLLVFFYALSVIVTGIKRPGHVCLKPDRATMILVASIIPQYTTDSNTYSTI